METDWNARVLVHDGQLFLVEAVLSRPGFADCCCRVGAEHGVSGMNQDKESC